MTRPEGEPLHNNPALHAFDHTRGLIPGIQVLDDFASLDLIEKKTLLIAAITDAAAYFSEHSHPRFRAIGSRFFDAMDHKSVQIVFPDTNGDNIHDFKRQAAPSFLPAKSNQEGERPVLVIPYGFGVKAIEDPIEALGLALYSFCEVEVFMNGGSEYPAQMIADAASATQAEFYLLAGQKYAQFQSRTAEGVIKRYPKGLRSFSLTGRIGLVPIERLPDFPRHRLPQ